MRLFPPALGLLLDLADRQLWGLGGPWMSFVGTTWVLVTAGTLDVAHAAGEFRLDAGMFAVLPGQARIGGEGRGLAIVSQGAPGLFQIGGPIEARGRLRYIDGCTDTLLVCPPRLGDACLNHLHIPAGTIQSTHTHPSDRVGVIVRGEGRCWTPEGLVPLVAGLGWWIPAHTPHHFETGAHALDVMAWHPDSDFGPTDADHPMINRTVRVVR
jgi:quercetin dioxygenase-like cupin family protein